jgi:hypothetical protein
MNGMTSKRKPQDSGNIEIWSDELWSDEEFEKLLQSTLSAIQPPEDFSAKVMAAVAQEAKPEKLQEQAEKAAPAKVIRFPMRRIAASLGACAAALLLFVSVSSLPADQSEPTAQSLLNKPLQVAEEPLLNQPAAGITTENDANSTAEPVNAVANTQTPDTSNRTDTNTASQGTSASAASNKENSNQANSNSNSNPISNQQTTNQVDNGELLLPRAAYGTESQGTLSTRLLATVENSRIYQPSVNNRSTIASFYTADAENVYSWRVVLTDPSQPEISLIADRTQQDVSLLLTSAAANCDSTTIVTSPDKTIMAQNSSDGIWISLNEGDVYKLTAESGGNLLVWSSDSSKLLFTNSEGALFLGYPLEKRIYQITDMNVKDVCISADNKTVLFVTSNDTQDFLYIVEVL